MSEALWRKVIGGRNARKTEIVKQSQELRKARETIEHAGQALEEATVKVEKLEKRNTGLRASLDKALKESDEKDHIQMLSTDVGRRVLGRREEEARTDPLTGIPNRRRFFEFVEEATKRLQRRDKPVSLLYIDIDNFKTINDTRGHDCGDVVLREISKTLRETVREADEIGRWGGEEFLVLAEDADERDATVLADKLLKTVRTLKILSPVGEPIPITVSIGIAAKTKKDDFDVLTFVNHADNAMYRAKRTGKDRAVPFTSVPEEERQLRAIEYLPK